MKQVLLDARNDFEYIQSFSVPVAVYAVCALQIEKIDELLAGIDE